MMMSSTDPTRSSLSLYTGCPRMVRSALQPVVTSRSSATPTPTVVEPATCACDVVGPIRAILASSRMRIDVMAGLRINPDPLDARYVLLGGPQGAGARPQRISPEAAFGARSFDLSIISWLQPGVLWSPTRIMQLGEDESTDAHVLLSHDASGD